MNQMPVLNQVQRDLYDELCENYGTGPVLEILGHIVLDCGYFDQYVAADWLQTAAEKLA